MSPLYHRKMFEHMRRIDEIFYVCLWLWHENSPTIFKYSSERVIVMPEPFSLFYHYFTSKTLNSTKFIVYVFFFCFFLSLTSMSSLNLKKKCQKGTCNSKFPCYFNFSTIEKCIKLCSLEPNFTCIIFTVASR